MYWSTVYSKACRDTVYSEACRGAVCWGALGILGGHVQWVVLGCSLHWGTQGTVVCSGIY